MARASWSAAVLVCAGLLAGGPWSGRSQAADPLPFTPAQRAQILAIELRRGPAADLEPFLLPNVEPQARRLALRALGRIGERGAAPALLERLLADPAQRDDATLMEACARNASARLEEGLTQVVEADGAAAPQALEALGWVAAQALNAEPGPLSNALAQRAAALASTRLEHAASAQRVAALTALALSRQEGYLERVLPFLDDASPAVAQEAEFAGWMLANARKRAASTLFKGSWSGDRRLAEPLARAAAAAAGERALARVRIVAPLLPSPASASEALDGLLGHADPRVVQETIARLLPGVPGPWLVTRLPALLAHADAKVRGATYDLLTEKDRGAAVRDLLRGRAEAEADPRLRDALAAALAAQDDEAAARAVLDDTARRSPDPLERALGEARALARATCSTGLEQLLEHARRHLDQPPVVLEVLGLVEDRSGAALEAFVAEALGHADPYVRAAAAGFVGKQRYAALLPRLDDLYAVPRTPAERDLAQAAVEAWSEWVKGAPREDAHAPALRARLQVACTSGPTFTARAAARKACRERRIAGAPREDAARPNDWNGLPRPAQPVLGVDLTQGGERLSEAEILALADRLAEERPEFVVQTTQGAFRLVVDPSEAPLHAVAFLLNVVAGTYAGTRWHRVVPSFVVQGGDPHGTGNGDAGYGLPDEITARRFVRGALGMPKGDIRDTGGCQLFVMHCGYRPLDGRYTCYGEVVDGMTTVDALRVGDRILGVQMVQPGR